MKPSSAAHHGEVADKSAPTSIEPRRGHQALRRYRVSLPNRTYFVTACTSGRRPLLSPTAIATGVFDQLRRLELNDHMIELLAMVVMPDHIHAVVRLADDTHIDDVMRRFRGAAARVINRALGAKGSLWQRGYYERRLRIDDNLAQVLHYMWCNPSPPGKHFRCRKEIWSWFHTCINDQPKYAEWLQKSP